MNKKIFNKTQWEILICTVLLTIIGFIGLFSTSKNSGYEEFTKQLIWFVISVIIMIIFIKVDYNTLAKISPYLYGTAILMLIGVLFTSAVNGAKSWFALGFFSFQPGEFSKVCVILFLSYSITKICRYREDINKPLNLLKILSIGLFPVFLIALEPDLGTAIAYVVALVLILFVSGINKKYIISAILLIIIIIPILYFFLLPEHAVNRINVYLNPNLDPRGIGYNIIQSKIAVGAGKLFGMGFGNGTQTQLGYLYPKTTDFIFSAIGEEFGFFVCGIIVALYVMLLTKAIGVAKNSQDNLGGFIAIGIVRNTIISYN